MLVYITYNSNYIGYIFLILKILFIDVSKIVNSLRIWVFHIDFNKKSTLNVNFKLHFSWKTAKYFSKNNIISLKVFRNKLVALNSSCKLKSIYFLL